MAIKQIISMPGGKLPDNMSEFEEGFKESNVGTGDQTFSVTLTKGSKRAIKSVYLFIPSAGTAAKFHVGRGSTGSYVKLCDNIYWNASTFFLVDDPIMLGSGLVIGVNTDAGAAVDVYVVVHYYYE